MRIVFNPIGVSMTVSLIPRGQNFIRSLIARHAVKSLDPEGLRRFAEANWGAFHAERIVKAAVSALSTTDFGEPEAQEFFGLVREQSVIGRLGGLRTVPFNVRMLRMVSGVNAYWIGQGNPIPLSKPSLDGGTLAPLKVATLLAVTEESMRANGAAESVLLGDMQRAVSTSLDVALLDPGNAGVADKMPASITYGVTPVASTGDPAADIEALVAAFTGDFSAAFFATDPTTATQIALARDAGGSFAFPDAGPRGGSILGIPLLVSRGSPRDSGGGQLALIDPSGIAGNVENGRVDSSDQTSLLMTDDPSGPGEMVSMYQTNSVAFKAEVIANWETQRAGSVALVTGAIYA
jgi:hypothetical protein